VALRGVEAGRHEDDIWVELPGNWEHYAAECCEVFRITKAGHCGEGEWRRWEVGEREKS